MQSPRVCLFIFFFFSFSSLFFSSTSPPTLSPLPPFYLRLIRLMDGLTTSKNDQVMVLACTNRPEALDPAFLRYLYILIFKSIKRKEDKEMGEEWRRRGEGRINEYIDECNESFMWDCQTRWNAQESCGLYPPVFSCSLLFSSLLLSASDIDRFF